MSSLIRNSAQAKQGIDFTGFQNGKIHPSDIDAVLEFNNEVLILIEAKRRGNEIPTGQRLLLERIVDSWHTGKAIAFLGEHTHYDTNTDIPIESLITKKYYHNKKWTETNEPLINLLNKLGEHWRLNKLKF